MPWDRHPCPHCRKKVIELWEYDKAKKIHVCQNCWEELTDAKEYGVKLVGMLKSFFDGIGIIDQSFINTIQDDDFTVESWDENEVVVVEEDIKVVYRRSEGSDGVVWSGEYVEVIGKPSKR